MQLSARLSTTGRTSPIPKIVERQVQAAARAEQRENSRVGLGPRRRHELGEHESGTEAERSSDLADTSSATSAWVP